MSTSLKSLASLAPELFTAFRRLNFTVAGISDYLGPAGTAAWRRGEPAAVRRCCGGDSELGALIRAFILKDSGLHTELTPILGTKIMDAVFDDAGQVCFDVLPHVIAGDDRWVFSDIDASMLDHVPGPEHVLGVGAASLSLLDTVPHTEANTVLDLGCGSGVQILGQLGVAKQLTGTDVHERALDLAAATLAEENNVELLQGSWFEPVAGRRFDRIVANPPFVVGLPEIGHVYRDSGLNLDGASELVVSQLREHLEPGGTAHVLAAWVHREGERWQQRVASWLPDDGVCAWIIQRDVVDPEMYVGTWLRDESIDPRSPEGQERTRIWLDHFAANNVTGIGFGFVALQRIDDALPSDILAEELSHELNEPLRDEVTEYFLRSQWLRSVTTEDIVASRYLVRPNVAIEVVSMPDTEAELGFSESSRRLIRLDGPRWSHEVDQHLTNIMSGQSLRGLCLGEILELYALANELDEGTFIPAALGACIDLIRHGFLIPEALLDMES